jgi:hypothetical protein
MALTISQISAASYPAILSEMRKATNNWAANPALRALEKAGFIKKQSLGENIEVPIDYRANPETAVLVGDQDTAALVSTDILTAAVYDIAQLNVPVTWTKGEEAKNPADSQKIALVRQKLENGITSHDDLLEQRIFTSSSSGGTEINGLADLISTAGTGTVGGINSTAETWWRNNADTFVDGSDIEAAMTEMFDNCAKGSGETNMPTMLLSGVASHSLYESQLQTMQRFVNSDEADSGFKVLAFKGAKYIYSHRGGTKIYFLSPKNYQMVASSQYFRDKGETNQVNGQNAFYFLIYSALQFVVTNRWRLGVLDQA